ncbi:protein AAR2 homolog [Eurytemora carolleeae]|uniref:protein AAR2 homolog n=1 Tax=Eurytemora carolleeae TaxID=1294199 RepID=UPI000C78C329|nr:protein AAR2 homolog [Eurytemora carolleeae]|eukprot:XP_023323214.1 protein AAR2 homolog [Eurytemora affinis]
MCEPPVKKMKSVQFTGVESPRDDGEMDPEVAKRLLLEGATLILLDVPPGTEIGIDMNSWNIGDKFRGVKMIPPGLHFVYYSSVNIKDRTTAPRTGFFYNFGRGELVARRWSRQEEDIVDTVTEEDRERMKADLLNLDRNLGSYPYSSWKKWISLSNRISDATLQRLEPINRKISSVTDMIPDSRDRTDMTSSNNDDVRLPCMSARPGTEVRYTNLWKQKYPEGSSAEEITRHSMDGSYQLTKFIGQLDKLYGDQVSSSMSDRSHAQEILAELQFSFLCFLVGMNYDSFEHWKELVVMMCSCDSALSVHPDLFMDFISDLYFQMQEVPRDFFVDIVSSDNFLCSCLNTLFSNMRSTQGVPQKLKLKCEKFETNVKKKFGWDFDIVPEDEEPVVVVL